MRAVTLASIRAHAARLVASTLAIVIAVGFVVATLVLDQTARATVLEAAGAQYVDTDVVVTSENGTGLAGDVDALAALDGVRAVDPSWQTGVQAVAPGRTGAQYLLVDSVAADPGLRWQQMATGSLPVRPGEVAVSERVGASVGDVLPVTSYSADGTATTSDATVTGVVDLRGDPTAGLYGRIFSTADQARAWGAEDPPELRVAGTAGTDPSTLAGQVRASLAGQDVTVRTGTEQAAVSAAALTGGTEWLTAILLVSPPWPCWWPAWSSPTPSPCSWPSGPATWRCCAASGPPPRRCAAAC
jgi:putative ABC transport system permease protein